MPCLAPPLSQRKDLNGQLPSGAIGLCNRSQWFRQTATYFEDKKQKALQGCKIRKLSDEIMCNTVEIRTNQGEERYRTFETVAESLSLKPCGILQVGFFKRIKHSIMPNIVREDWPQVGERMLRERGFDKIASKLVTSIAPRRFGKSVMFCIVICAYLLAMPRSKQVIFSTGKRICQAMATMVYNTLCDSGYGHLVYRCSSEKLILKSPEGTAYDFRTLLFLPSNPKISIL